MDLSRFRAAIRLGSPDPSSVARHYKDSPSAPPPPDYVGAATAQGVANKDSAIASAQLSNPNINGPYGSQQVSYSLDPTTGNPVPTINQSLSPEQQQLLSSQNRMQMGLADLGQQSLGTVQNVMGTPFNGGAYPLKTSLDTSGVARMPVNAGTTAQDAILKRLEPTMARARASRETDLVNQGLRPGMEAYGNAEKDLAFQENDARTQAALQGINVDMNANQQGFGQAVQEGQFGNTAQQQAYQQGLSNYNLPLNQITALMSGSQVTNPQFQNYGGSPVASAPIMNAAQQQGLYGQNLFSNQTAQTNAMNSGLASLGSSALMYAALA